MCMLRFAFEEGVSMESGGREADACLRQRKMERKGSYGSGWGGGEDQRDDSASSEPGPPASHLSCCLIYSIQSQGRKIPPHGLGKWGD